MQTSDARLPALGDVAALLERVRERYAEALAAYPFLGRRLEAHLPDVWRGYRTLYPQADAEAFFGLMDVVVGGLEGRTADLVASDLAREEDPAWFQSPRLVGMMLYVDLFAGDLAGVAEKIPYLRELGITYLHLMPLLQSREGPNDGGYAVSDYRTVDPRLGTMGELRDLARRLREAGILLVLDVVMNHTAREHAWAEAALRGDERFQRYYFLFEDRTLPDAYERTLPEVFPEAAPGSFTWQPEIERWAWTTFYPFQWDLDYTNPAVFRSVFEEMLFLANVGVDVLRLDAVPFMWKRLGTNSQNQPEVLQLLGAYRALMRIAAPGVLFKAEAIVAPEDIVRYLGVGGYEGKACDIAYHATLMNHLWHALAAENAHLLRSTLKRLPEAPKTSTWINYVRCHDDIGWGISDGAAAAVHQDGHQTRLFCTAFYAGEWPGSYAEGYRFQPDPHSGEARTSGTAAALAGLQKALVEADDERVEAALKRLLLLHGVIYFMRGIPLLYSGDELGQLNSLAYLQDPRKATDNRWLHRPPMDWAKAERRHTPGTPEHRLFEGLRRLADVRRRQPALDGRGTERVLIPDSDGLFLVHRHSEGEDLLLAANVSRHWQRAALGVLPDAWEGGHFRDVLTGRRLHFTTGRLAVPPYGCLWLAPEGRGGEGKKGRGAEGGIEDRGVQHEPARTVRVDVRLRVETEWGERVHLVGNLDALGAWQPDHALPMTLDGYPFWRTSVEVPEGAVFEMRWLRKRDGVVAAEAPDVLYGIGFGEEEERKKGGGVTG